MHRPRRFRSPPAAKRTTDPAQSPPQPGRALRVGAGPVNHRMDQPSATPVAVSSDGPVSVIRMRDPARRNALSEAMLAGLMHAFDTLPHGTRAVVLGAGPADKVWCAGFDISALAPGRDPLARDGQLQALFSKLADCPAPVIAMLHGSAWGGGTDLALR